jgi:hypothetical protein
MNVNNLKEKEKEKIMAGKIVFINGAPFSGKSYLISYLTEKFPHIKTVNYELFCNLKDGYTPFYEKVISLSKAGEDVIAESVSSKIDNYDCFSDSMTIAMRLGDDKHRDNMISYRDTFGRDSVVERIGTYSLSTLRGYVRFPRTGKVITYRGENIDFIEKAVSDYVLAS